jgi:hypothetical protein
MNACLSPAQKRQTPDYEERYKQRVLANLRRRAKSLGYVLQATDSTPSVAEVS